MAIINGATTLEEVIKTVKSGFFSVIRVCAFLYIRSLSGMLTNTPNKISWVVSPLSLTIAQKFIPVEVS